MGTLMGSPVNRCIIFCIDEAWKVDNDKAARVARLAFLLAYHVAQDPTAPEWTEEGWARVQEMLGG